MSKRQQLSLYVPFHKKPIIEFVRSSYNPAQSDLIPAHVTLCRNNEIKNWNTIQDKLEQIENISINLKIQTPLRFENNGVYLPCIDFQNDFQNLRNEILKDLIDDVPIAKPHITLMHPRNSVCTDKKFEEILNFQYPDEIEFHSIHLIQQYKDEAWQILQTFKSSPVF